MTPTHGRTTLATATPDSTTITKKWPMRLTRSRTSPSWLLFRCAPAQPRSRTAWLATPITPRTTGYDRGTHSDAPDAINFASPPSYRMNVGKMPAGLIVNVNRRTVFRSPTINTCPVTSLACANWLSRGAVQRSVNCLFCTLNNAFPGMLGGPHTPPLPHITSQLGVGRQVGHS